MEDNINPMVKRIRERQGRHEHQESQPEQQEQRQDENQRQENTEAVILEQELPVGNLWTRIIDFEKLGGNTQFVFSFDEDLESFIYVKEGQENTAHLPHKIYYDPDEQSKTLADATCKDY